MATLLVNVGIPFAKSYPPFSAAGGEHRRTCEYVTFVFGSLVGHVWIVDRPQGDREGEITRGE